MKRDRYLIGIVVGIGALIVVAVGMFILRRDAQEYLSEETPDGVVHNYILALHHEDYKKAYGYLADEEDKPSMAEFITIVSNGYSNISDVSMQIIGFDLIQNEDGSQGAVIDLVTATTSMGPFDIGYRSYDTALLVMQDNEWKIISMPYRYWGWDWYPMR